MKKKNFMKVGFGVLVLAIALIVMPSLQLSANQQGPKGAKDPHEHVGTKTVCYNTSKFGCDS